ncbi:MAG: MGH1-like glycoside hydrolase domain-containing protein, partial [Pseudomonadales bacterium]
GPTWLHINWMIAIGLEHYGLNEVATRVKQASHDIINHHGYWEYYDPCDGEGCGGLAFSWTAAIALYWLL